MVRGGGVSGPAGDEGSYHSVRFSFPPDEGCYSTFVRWRLPLGASEMQRCSGPFRDSDRPAVVFSEAAVPLLQVFGCCGHLIENHAFSTTYIVPLFTLETVHSLLGHALRWSAWHFTYRFSVARLKTLRNHTQRCTSRAHRSIDDTL